METSKVRGREEIRHVLVISDKCVGNPSWETPGCNVTLHIQTVPSVRNAARLTGVVITDALS